MPRASIHDPLTGYNFRVSIPGVPQSCGFAKASGLVQELNVATYDEGGYTSTHKIKGKRKTGELVLTKGMFPNKDLENVFRNAFSNSDYRITCLIELLDSQNNVARKWTLLEAWCSKWEVAEFDASADAIIMESITIQYEEIID